jgi:hypothetical protein
MCLLMPSRALTPSLEPQQHQGSNLTFSMGSGRIGATSAAFIRAMKRQAAGTISENVEDGPPLLDAFWPDWTPVLTRAKILSLYEAAC